MHLVRSAIFVVHSLSCCSPGEYIKTRFGCKTTRRYACSRMHPAQGTCIVHLRDLPFCALSHNLDIAVGHMAKQNLLLVAVKLSKSSHRIAQNSKHFGIFDEISDQS